MTNMKNNWLFRTCDFNKEHVVLPYIVTIYNISEEKIYITCMTTTGFINDQDESRCYVSSSFQVHFLYLFQTVHIFNVDSDKTIDEPDNSEDEFNTNPQKFLTIRVI